MKYNALLLLRTQIVAASYNCIAATQRGAGVYAGAAVGMHRTIDAAVAALHVCESARWYQGDWVPMYGGGRPTTKTQKRRAQRVRAAANEQKRHRRLPNVSAQ